MAGRTSARVYEELLVTLARAGNRRAAERLAARWYPRLMRTAMVLLQDRDQAEDAVQEAWFGICRGWTGLHDAALFPAWAFSILRRKCADRIRREMRQRARTEPMDGASEPARECAGELRASLSQALGSLSEDHRLTALLYFAEGLSLKEIAAATGVPVGTAKSRLFYARKHLKSTLEGD